ncbi:hypothetical protein LQ564_08460 [Massilia sp. G4R7]|uniref:Uncharacterized protein n=1 Tax=Massilia phyllostachyos TaxID=2898585 RepID=A0ABS8Q3M4_9BURK|nr:hypothetical protein [Massilia phyllostachyos]MCD2516345.1 hypothetical protein [Massilia phyllostachyos]
MKTLHTLALGALLAGGSAAAADTQPVRELDPVHVNAMRNPEVRKYKHILAGLDTFDKHHALAPRVDRLRFVAEPRKKQETPAVLKVRLAGDDGFTLPIAVDAAGRFEVPRSEAAEDAKSELELNQKKGAYRIAVEVKTPGLPDNRRRLGDLRLECKVQIAIAKSEIPFYWVGVINGFLLRTDWCSFFGDEKSTAYDGAARDAHFGYRAGRPIKEAILVEGNRSALLRSKGQSFEVPIGNSTWSDEAMVELTFLDDAPLVTASTGTAGETPRTAP